MATYSHRHHPPLSQGSPRADSVDIHDLPAEQASLVRDFVAFLRRKLRGQQDVPSYAWAAMADTSFAQDWDNPQDAQYDQWHTHYHVS